nr:unnamed protein product [Callosobruchus analis]
MEECKKRCPFECDPKDGRCKYSPGTKKPDSPECNSSNCRPPFSCDTEEDICRYIPSQPPEVFSKQWSTNKMAGPEKDSDFFDKAEKALNVKVPESLKYLLIACGFEEQSVFGTITNENISEIEEFARNNLHQIIDEKDLDRYYGIYRNKPTLYKIPIGHRNIITMLKGHPVKIQTRRIILDNRQKRHGFPKADEGNAKKHCRSQLESNEKCSVSETKSSLELPEENFHITDEKMKTERKIYDALLQWVKNKMPVEDWNKFNLPFDKISVSALTDEEKCMISCFCGTKNSSCERWIYSNFQQHLLKKHINCIASGTLKPTTSVKRNQLITSYLKEKSQEFFYSISGSTISSNINKDSAEGIDFYNNYQIVNTQNEPPLNSATAGEISSDKLYRPGDLANDLIFLSSHDASCSSSNGRFTRGILENHPEIDENMSSQDKLRDCDSDFNGSDKLDNPSDSGNTSPL